MSSSEEYLDSLLDSILSGGKSDEEEKPAAEESRGASAENRAADAGKAMSPDEIEEMLVSMGTLSGEEEGAQEQNSEDDMEAMLAFMNEHNSDEGGSDALNDDSAASDDFVIEDLSLDDLPSEEPEDSEMDALDDLPLDDMDMGESGAEEISMDELSLDDLSLDDLPSEEPEDSAMDALDDLSLDDLDMGESGAEEASVDELSLDDLSLDEQPSEDMPLEESEDSALDGLDDLSLDDLDMGESETEEVSTGDLSLDELALEDSGAEEAGDEAADDFTIDELSLDDLSSEESENMEEDADGLMSEEDIDRLLSGDMSTEDEAVDDFALEETGSEGDDDLSALLAGMDHDEDLSEINNLLEESDQGVSVDDDMLAMLEGVDQDGSFDLFESDEAAREAESIRELSPEEVAEREGGDGKGKKEKKKRKKLFGRKKKADSEEASEGADDELEALLGEVGAPETSQEEKKPGFFARLLEFLLESDEEDEDPLAAEILADNDGETGTVTDENKELLQELSDEDKKGKKKKKKKDKKGKKGKEEEEDGKKAKKPKKEKKKKEKKKPEEVDLFAPPEKKLSKKKVITVFMFCGTMAAGIIVLVTILPDTMQKRDAYAAYDHGEYAEVYDLLYGKELSEEDEVIFQGSNLILQMDRKLSSYENYVNLDMRMEALNALITGVEKYQQILPEAESYNVVAEVNDIYSQILERLSANFGLSEGDAWDILASEDDVTYTMKLQAVIDGERYDVEEAEEPVTPDILPEEEEIIERIGGIEGGTETEVSPEAEEYVIGGVDGETEIVIEPGPDEAGEDDQASDENADEGTE